MTVKSLDIEDPMEVAATTIPDHDGAILLGMAASFAEEFLMMGWSSDAVRAMFASPHYHGAYQAYDRLGPDAIKQIVTEAAERLRRKRER